jgi:hypothetical protein
VLTSVVLVAAATTVVMLLFAAVVVWVYWERLLAKFAVKVADEQRRRAQTRLYRHRPVERFRSGAMTDEDPRTVEAREQERRAEERRAKLEAGRTIARERGWST